MWDKVGPKNWRRPLLLRPDNFTPPERTPWGGKRIVGDLKSQLGLTHGDVVVGEAWELSVEPDFPSQLVDGPTLDEVLRSDPPALLGAESPLGSTALLVKLLDAADDLSVQIHPEESDPMLADDESGKPEAWYIIDAEPGSGLYLGFLEGVSRDVVKNAIDEEDDVSALMRFVPVSAGDVFVIEPGTPHAVGRGVMLLEPQRVSPAKRGITYRYWDWNRRYDAEGNRDPSGALRTLHLDRALDVTRWRGPREGSLLEEIRHRAGPAAVDGNADLELLISGQGPLQSAVFRANRLSGTGRATLPTSDTLRSLTVLGGRVVIGDDETELEVRRGQTAALPTCLGPLPVTLDRAHAIICSLA
ncbi:MAG: class I mannose-6-phosphate isomerase [Myxococcales bacterium]|nr:class I mannose-6-phosphate isomerase [Myxococcales bacterium]MDH3484039.1 class I mannose-6-phosphate isomerase [Myxococcales bacterium]